ncbi:MAG: TetR/AcrR family transcriptional regulator [Pseudomonadota bacterium]|jgi:AcrR family transcriptional regulator
MRQLSENQLARRADVVECAWRVIIRDGVDRASIRSIAQELGGTTGIVTHYFRDKDELLLFALDRVIKAMQAVEFPEKKSELTIKAIVGCWLKILPTSKESRDNWRVWTAFTGYAVGREHLMAEYRKSHNEQVAEVAKGFATLRAAGLLHPKGNDRDDAIACLALIDGLGIAWVINPDRYPEKVFRTVLSDFFDARAP